ncbi:MAG: flagellar biosynthetic protein FliQ [Deltaproteobacteria bacterium]|nr:MAG: flagellar biosynthetic protein FliQ [Deltaproteobacteria bacterium]
MTTADLLVRVGREALYLVVLLSAPIVIASLVVGLAVSIFQATTQIQDQTLTFAPKLVAVLVALAVFAPWIGSQLGAFSAALMELIPRLTG